MEIILTKDDLVRILKSKFNNVKEVRSNTKNLKITIELEDSSILDKRATPLIEEGKQDERIVVMKEKFGKGDEQQNGKGSIKHPPKVATLGNNRERKLTKL